MAPQNEDPLTHQKNSETEDTISVYSWRNVEHTNASKISKGRMKNWRTQLSSRKHTGEEHENARSANNARIPSSAASGTGTSGSGSAVLGSDIFGPRASGPSTATTGFAVSVRWTRTLEENFQVGKRWQH